MSFEVRYAVPMHCGQCAESVSTALNSVTGLDKFEIDLPNQTITTFGTAPPSDVIDTLKSAGRDAFVRGTGAPNSSAVCILEHPATGAIGGLARLIAISPGKTLIDITTKPAAEGSVAVHAYGDISLGATTIGPVTLKLGQLKNGKSVGTHAINLNGLIGRAIAVENPELVGVIARSAGLWENDKTVCSCSGQTVWQERQRVESKY